MKSHIIILLLLFFTIISCDNEYPKEDQKLVIEGWIENGEFPVVLVSLSGNIDNNGDKIADFMVRWAKVTINDGDSTYILMGKPDKNYFPPYIYTSFDLRGEVGKNYTLEVEYNDMKAISVTSIPNPIDIEAIETTKVENSDSLHSINVIFSPKSIKKEYFKLRYRDYKTETRFYPSFLGTFYTENNTDTLSTPLYRSKLKTVKDYIPYFHTGATIEVRLGHISEESYKIWNDYDNIVNFGSSFFFKQQTNLHTNIQGGYGYWIGYGISKHRITLK